MSATGDWSRRTRLDDYLCFRNFRQFGVTRRALHLPSELLDDQRFRRLPDAHKAHLLCLLLLAVRMGNVLPRNSGKLASLIAATEPIDLDAFTEFIDRHTSLAARQVVFERRPISDSVRAAVIVRDGGRCRVCGSARNLEVDHIVPVSKGGGFEEVNLQTLCRRCNRRKWKKLVPRICR